jgi:hypothetical protein
MLNMDKVNFALTTTEAKIETLTIEKRTALENSLRTLEPREIVAYQELKSIAQIEGKISLEVALWMYNVIGHYGSTKLAEKVVFTQLIAALIGR